jgi:undecaprenyl-diphosphatase
VGHLTWLEAIVIGGMQGVAELFPVSSLGHSILIPALVGGTWAQDLDVSAPESPYLAFVVGLHVATALALVVYFWRDWVRIIRGLMTSIVRREVADADQRLAWLLVLATIPVGVSGLLLEHVFRVYLSKPIPTAAFLALNGVLLLVGERLRRRADVREEGLGHSGSATPAFTERTGAETAGAETAVAADRRLAELPVGQAVLIGAAQIAALAPGLSRSGSAMVAGLTNGLSHTDAARFSFLLATPVILAAGLLKLGDLAGPLGDGIRPQILVGSLLSGLGAYISVRFLTRWFETRSLRPFGIYCLVAGLGCLVWFSVR